MVFEAHNTPEARLGQRQLRDRKRAPLDVIVNTYWDQAEKMLNGEAAIAVREETKRFAEKITKAREGVEQEEHVSNLFNALKNRKIEMPDGLDTEREKIAFGLALSRVYLQSVH